MHADCMLLHVCSALASIPSLLAVCVWLETLGRMLPDPAKANLLTAVDADVLAVTRCTGGVGRPCCCAPQALAKARWTDTHWNRHTAPSDG